MGLSRTVEPTVLPISVEEAKRFLRVKGSSEDADVESLIKAAVGRIETETGRQLLEATYTLTLDDAPCGAWLYLPRPNLLSVESIQYVDAAGATQTWNSGLYQVSKPSGPHGDFGRIAPIYGGSWPTVKPGTFDAFTVTFKAGYGATADKVPAEIVQATRLIVASLYRKREDEIDHQFRSGVAAMPSKASRLIRGFWKRETW